MLPPPIPYPDTKRSRQNFPTRQLPSARSATYSSAPAPPHKPRCSFPKAAAPVPHKSSAETAQPTSSAPTPPPRSTTQPATAPPPWQTLESHPAQPKSATSKPAKPRPNQNSSSLHLIDSPHKNRTNKKIAANAATPEPQKYVVAPPPWSRSLFAGRGFRLPVLNYESGLPILISTLSVEIKMRIPTLFFVARISVARIVFPNFRAAYAPQQLPRLPILPVKLLPAPRPQMQSTILRANHLIRNDEPQINRDQQHRKVIHRPRRIHLPLRTHHIQAVFILPPLINRRLHLHPLQPPRSFHPHVINPGLPKRTQHLHPQSRRNHQEIQLRPLSAFLAILQRPARQPMSLPSHTRNSPSPKMKTRPMKRPRSKQIPSFLPYISIVSICITPKGHNSQKYFSFILSTIAPIYIVSPP